MIEKVPESGKAGAMILTREGLKIPLGEVQLRYEGCKMIGQIHLITKTPADRKGRVASGPNFNRSRRRLMKKNDSPLF